MFWQPTRTIRVPLYYTGLTHAAMVREKEGKPQRYMLNRQQEMEVSVTLPSDAYTWLVIE